VIGRASAVMAGNFLAAVAIFFISSIVFNAPAIFEAVRNYF